jgi:hypothetical protein
VRGADFCAYSLLGLYSYGASTSGRSIQIVTVLGLVGGPLGGRHRASPIHRRRARAASFMGGALHWLAGWLVS